MTNTTIGSNAGSLKRGRSPFWWLWPLSCAIHVALLAVLIGRQVLTSEITFDRERLAKEAQEADLRAKQRAQRDRAERGKRVLSREHQQRLQNEVERRPRLDMIKHIKSLERSREQIEAAKEANLDRVEKRTEEDYRRRLLEQIVAIAETIELYSGKEFQRSGLFMRYGQMGIAQFPEMLPESFEERVPLGELDDAMNRAAKRIGEGYVYDDDTVKEVSAALERAEQFVKQRLDDSGGAQLAEETRQIELQLIEKINLMRDRMLRHERSWPLVPAGQEAVVKAKALQQKPEDREVAFELISIASALATQSAKSLDEKAYPPVQLHRASLELEELVKRLLDDPPDMKEFNDVSAARRPPDPATAESKLSERALRKATPKTLYQTARKLEREIEQHFNDNTAADLAVRNNTSFNEAAASARQRQTNGRPDLAPTLDGKKPQTIGEMNAHRASVNAAADQVQSMDRNGRFLLSQITGETKTDAGGDKTFVGAVASSGAGQGSGSGGSIVETREEEGGAHMEHRKIRPSVRLRLGGANVMANVLPGRRFSSNTPRTGWLYVDTWYIIGPWENHGRIDYTNIHPPESEIDFDAAYTDGKLGMSATAARRLGNLDGALRWRFTQSDTIRIRPVWQAADSTYYAYTELYFEEAKELLVGSPADDCVRVWINKRLVHEDKGLAQWSFHQGFYPVQFKKGTNRVLIRLENGPNEVVFTFILVPPELAAPQ